MSSSMSQSPSPSGSSQNMVDIVDSMLDFSSYDDNNSYQSPSLSLAENKTTTSFNRPSNVSNNGGMSLLSTAQPMNGPSHEYNRYKQQTGIVPGALASTLAFNQSNPQIAGYSGVDYDAYLNVDNAFSFNAPPSQHTVGTSDMDMDMKFESPMEPSLMFSESTINPNVMGGHEMTSIPSPPPVMQSTNNARVFPGVHQQAALAKQQAQQKQQQQQPQPQQAAAPSAKPRAKSAQQSDPLVEQKITQLLNSMRAKSASSEDLDDAPHSNYHRMRKDEEDMDEDERLLASEEGKKLSSKERRQLRNKVSARAFRSRRKEYIGQLEAEIAGKVSENGDLRAENRQLGEEVKRLTDLTRMLLSSSAFSEFLNDMSNPTHMQQAPQTQLQAQHQAQPQQQQAPKALGNRRMPKDVNPYAAQQATQNQQIGLTMIPEQTVDFSMLSLEPIDTYNYQPQVFTAVLETPEIDASVLSGKTDSAESMVRSDNYKMELPSISHPPALEHKREAIPSAPVVVDEAFESDPDFSLYHESSSSTTVQSAEADIFGGVQAEKVFARLSLVDVSEKEVSATVALARVQRISAGMDAVCARLERLTVDL